MDPLDQMDRVDPKEKNERGVADPYSIETDFISTFNIIYRRVLRPKNERSIVETHS